MQHVNPAARFHWILLVVIVLAGLFVRIVQIDAEGLWTDEALTLVIRHAPVYDLMFRPVDPTAGLYYLLVKLLPDGVSALVLRSISVAFGTASIPVTYLIARSAWSPRKGLVAAAMLAVSPALVDYSQDGRAYSLLIFLVLVAAASLLRWHRALAAGRRGFGALAIFAGATVLSLYTHFTAVFWIVPAVVIGREIGDRNGGRKPFTIAAVAMAVAALPEVVRTYTHVSRFGTLGIVSRPDLGDLITVSAETMLPMGGWLALLSALLFCFWRIWRSDHGVAVAVALSLLSVPASVWLFSYLVTPIFIPRSLLLGIPGFVLLLAFADFPRWPVAGTAFVIAATASLALHGTVRPKEPWRAIAADLKAKLEPGDGILVCPGWRAPALAHAMGETSHVMFTTRQDGVALVDRGNERTLFGPVIGWRVDGRPPTRPATTPARIWIVDFGCTEPVRQWLREGKYLTHTPHLQLYEGQSIARPVQKAP